MVKAYLRYELTSSWGVLCSNSNVTYDRSGKYLITSSLENVSLWNPKQGMLVSAFVAAQGMGSLLGAGHVWHQVCSPLACRSSPWSLQCPNRGR